jgi:phenolic acid decarboxylase
LASTTIHPPLVARFDPSLWFFSLYDWIVDHPEHVAEYPELIVEYLEAPVEYPEAIVEYPEVVIQYPSSWTLMKLTSRRNCSWVVS